MLKRLVGWVAVACLVVGGIQYVSNNPHEAADNSSHLFNEGVDTGGGLIEGFSEFIGNLDF